MLGRLTSKTWTTGSTTYTTTYTYKDHPTNTSLTSTQVASIQNGSNSLISYAYDKNGNITSITEGTNTIQYVYNELNEVVRENNQRDSKTFVYNYDLGGNLLSKIEYAYTTGEDLGIPVNTISYAYGDTNWKALMTSFDGKAITYDAIGNPLTYDGGTFAWEGRKLTSFSKSGLAVSYTYNENGIRTSKTVNTGSNVTTNYRLSGDKVTFEQTGSNTIYYVYDTQGQLISMILNNAEYAYLRNAQNDIVGLINSAGVQVVSYTYSTWGEVLTISGSLASTVGQQNPYRYRGYRYDSETGLYYLQSRYYSPQWGRFLNADGFVSTSKSVLSKNMFVYCGNNPVNFHDDGGYRKNWIISGLLFIAAIVLSVFDAVNDTAVGEVIDGGNVVIATYEIASIGKNAINDKEIHTRNVISAGTTKIPKIIPLKTKGVADDMDAYVDSLGAKYENMCITSSLGESIRGKTLENMSDIEIKKLVGEMMVWDFEVYSDLGIDFGKDASEKAGGALYGTEE